MRRFLSSILALVVFAAVGRAGPVAGQAGEPFGSMTIEAGGLVEVGRTTLGDYWRPSVGVAMAVGMPFYWGNVRGEIQQLDYDSRSEGLTDFGGRRVFVEWTLPVRLTGTLSLEGGGRLGVFQMRFDDETHAQARDEQEVAAALVAGVTYRAGRRWAFHLRASRGTVRLVHPVTQTFVSAGVSYRFETPGWLQEALR